MIKYVTVSDVSIELMIFFTPNFSWMAHHHKLERCVFVVVVMCVCVSKLDCCFQGQGLRDG